MKPILGKLGQVFIVGEVAQAHDGSLGMAHAFIDAIAKAGADAVKFQTHIASAESTPAEPWRVKFSQQDETRYAYWKRMEFTTEQWAGLKRHTDEHGLKFLSSAFSIEAVELLSRLGVVAWKIASGEVTNGPLFDAMARTRLPFLISTGMSYWSEIDAAVERVRAHGCQVIVMQCTSMYPTPPEKTGLNVIPAMRERYGPEVGLGLSDHSGTIFPGLAAAALGIDVLEVHVAFSRDMFGPDVSASVTTQELKQLVDGVRAIEAVRANPVDKDEVAGQLQPMRSLFTKSIVAKVELAPGTVLTAEHLALKKPGHGMSPERLPAIIGKRTKHAISKDQLLCEADLE